MVMSTNNIMSMSCSLDDFDRGIVHVLVSYTGFLFMYTFYLYILETQVRILQLFMN